MQKSRRQYNLWKLEFIKCNSRKKLQEYVNKYTSVPDNPFVSKAKELLSENNSATPHKQFEIKYINEVIYVVLMAGGFIGLIAICSIFSGTFHGWLYNLKSSITDDSNVEVTMPTVQPTLPTSTSESYTEPSLEQSSEPLSEPPSNAAPSPQPQPYIPPYYNAYPTQTSQPDAENNSRWEEMYRSQYAEMERQAERNYHSLTNLGGRFNNSGSMDGYTGRNDPYIVGEISVFKQLQQRMRDLRYEASKKGINISQSHWETANINI